MPFKLMVGFFVIAIISLSSLKFSRMKKLVCILLFACFSVTLFAQNINTSAAPDGSVDYSRLKKIDTLVNGYIQRDWVKGVVTIIVKDNQVIQYKGYGVQDDATKKPMPANALFRIASQTKAIVSAGVMTLYEDGKIELDEPIADFIPEFKNPVVLDKYNAADTSYTTVPAKRDITFRDLLTHSSGLDYADIGNADMVAIYHKAGLESGLGVFDANLVDKMKVLAKLPLKYQPGEKWNYSLGIDVLGALIEVISGDNLESYLSKRLFIPLGMKDTYFNVPAEKGPRLAAVYTEDEQHHIIPWGKTFRNIDPAYPLANKHYFSGGAGLTSTAFDYAIFLQMMLNGGKYNGVQVLAPRTVQLMISPQPGVPFGDDGFGLGFGITGEKSALKNARNQGSFSWGGYFGTTYWADPKAKMVCLIMTQQSPNSHGDLSAKFEQLVYQALK